MEIIRGKHASFMDASDLAKCLSGYESIHIDIGTGDGHFVRHIAQVSPNRFVIGVDACRENLREVSQRPPVNGLFVIANAEMLPPELHGLASSVTINFPWGSLLEGLLETASAVLTNLIAIMRPDAELEVRLNGGALAEAGWTLEEGAKRVRDVLQSNGFSTRPPIPMAAQELKVYPTTWAKRLAFGRDPRAVYLRGEKESKAPLHDDGEGFGVGMRLAT